MLSAKNEKFRVNWISRMNKILHFARIKFSGRFLKLQNPQNPGKLVLLRYKVSVKMSERFDDFFGISESWRAFDESRFNVSFSISDFEILLNFKYLFVCLLFIATMLWWSCYWILDMIDISWLVVFWNIKRVFTWDFILGKMKYFHFGICSISCNCLHVHPEVKLITGVV